MQTKKMSLVNIQGKLSRAEMKNVMAGVGRTLGCACASDSDCGGSLPYCNKQLSCDEGKTKGGCSR